MVFMNKLLFFGSLSVCLSAAFVCPLACSADVYASALNANESLALFGTSIPALYYNGVGVDNCVFEYVGSTFDVKQYAVDMAAAGNSGTIPPNVDIGGRGTWLTSTLGGGLFDDQNTPSFFNDDFIRGTNYLIYRCGFDSGLPSSATNFDFQIQVDSSIGIESQAIAFSCMWTAPDALSGRYNNNASHLYLYNASGFPAGEIASVIGGRPGNSSWSGNYWLGHVGVYLSDVVNYAASDARALLINNQPAFCGCFIRAGDVTNEDAEPISFNGFRLNCKNVDKYFKYNFDWSTESIVADGTTQYVYLLVQCPWVYGDFVLPEPEDNTSLGDINDNIDNLVVSTDELRKILLRIESTNNDILTVERTHTQQFIDILSRLQAIYDKMYTDGEIPLEYADDLPFNESAMSRVEDALEDYELPDLAEDSGVHGALDGWGGLMSALKDALPGKVWAFFVFSIVAGLVHWVIFHGRGGS